MSKKEVRIANMEQILHKKGIVRVKEMAQLLDVSEMTIRRDVQLLEQTGRVKNLNGMLISAEDNSFGVVSQKYDLLVQAKAQDQEKRAIGKFAASRISAGDSVMLDIGSSIEQIAQQVSGDIKFDAMCLTLNTLLSLLDKPLVTTALAGGYYQAGTQIFLSDEGIRFIRSVRANKLFLSAAGIHENLGISCANPYEVSAKKALLQSARYHILVADSSKFGVVRSSYFCDLDVIDEIITDDRLPESWVKLIEDRGIVLHRVPLK